MKTGSIIAGGIWAVTVLVLAIALPDGKWTIDDGVKSIMVDSGTGIWNEFIPDGPVRARLADPAAFAPLHSPFAQRETGGFSAGFSPWARAFIGGLLALGVWGRLIAAAAAVMFWLRLRRDGMPLAFLLLPLTFYALVPWEHLWSWLLLWPALWITFVPERSVAASTVLAGILLTAAVLLRPETLVVASLLPIVLLLQRRPRAAALLTIGAAAAAVAALALHAATAQQSAFAQIRLNLLGSASASFTGWLASRPRVFYELLVAMDAEPLWSMAMIVLLVLGSLLLLAGSRRRSAQPAAIAAATEDPPRLMLIYAGYVLLVMAVVLGQYRLWSATLPPLVLLKSGSLFVAAPWVIALLLPPYRKRPALWTAAIATAMLLLITPVWSGVHWGPRILLCMLPLLLIDTVQSGRIRTLLFAALVVITVLQTAGSAALVWARMDENADHTRQLQTLPVNVPVICPTMSQCVELAPLWPRHEFFTAPDPRELRQLLIEMRFAAVDTVVLHIGIKDPLFEQSIAALAPLTVTRTETFAAGTLYRTAWIVREIALNRGDSRWTAILEAEAGRQMLANDNARALRLQRAAVTADPASASARHNLALLLARLGLNDEARTAARYALDLDSTLREPRLLLNLLAADSVNAPGVEARESIADPSAALPPAR